MPSVTVMLFGLVPHVIFRSVTQFVKMGEPVKK